MTNLLVAKARAVADQLSNALTWVGRSDNPEVLNNYRLKKDLRKSISQIRRLEQAAESKMCVGVYGASQAGKSYLVSVLARNGTEPLTAVLGAKEIDFIREINPAGGQESTGLVTRFTIDPIKTPEKFPIKAKLLSELDLIKIFVNTYVFDVDVDEQDEVESRVRKISDVLAAFETMPRSNSHFSVEDVYDLEEYCNAKFQASIHGLAIKKSDYWARAVELIPTLGTEARNKLIELLWDETPALTAMYRLLASELNRLGYPDVLYCSASALFDEKDGQWVRGKQSVINVSTLDRLGSQDDAFVEIFTEKSNPTKIALSTLCGLISELVIPLKDKPHDFFECTDLLDFPGARSRNVRSKKELQADASVQVAGYLRGKVAYLFDKYSADLELSSMLLCVGPSNLEVTGLPRLVEDWVIHTHGRSPEERDQLPTALFLVLTKFDTEFTQSAGQRQDGSRWTTRLEANLLKPFGENSHQSNWVKKWDVRGAFRNTFWLRNPNADQFGLIQYEGDVGRSKEIGIAPERIEHVKVLRDAFVANELVLRHFQSPGDAWDAGMRMNDGGVGYLVAGLSTVCKPGVKSRQVNERINAILRERELDLRKYFVSSDKQDLIREKRELAERFLKSGASIYQKKRLGELINFLFVSDRDTQDIFRRLESQFEREKNASRVESVDENAQAERIDADLASALGLTSAEPAKSEEQSTITKSSVDFPERFVMNFFGEWASSVLARATGSNALTYLHLDRSLLIQLLNELDRAAKRVGLMEHLKSVMRANYQYRSTHSNSRVLQQTSILTGLFNQFLVYGGCAYGHQQTPVTIESLDGKMLSVFKPAPDTIEIEMPELAEDFSKTYLIEWLQAIQFSIRSNAEYMAQEAGDTQSNRELGQVLSKLAEVIDLGST
jgi:hypothetical protein